MINLKRKLLKYPFIVREILLNYPNERRNFRNRVGYPLDLDSPRSLNEKIVWKKIHDRNPLLTISADKVKVRDYVKYVLDEEDHSILIPSYYQTTNPTEIPFDSLPHEYIIKANHGSGTNMMITDKSNLKRSEIVRICQSWLNQDYGFLNFEWCYRNITRKITVDKLLRDKNGDLPDDYKFHIIHGKWFFVHVNHQKFVEHLPSLYDRDWNKLDVSYKGKIGPEVKKPKSIERMVSIAERLGQYFDYVRVDLYLCDDDIYFGELTNYPASGSAKYSPVEFDYLVGKQWNLVENYWKDNGALDVYKSLR